MLFVLLFLLYVQISFVEDHKRIDRLIVYVHHQDIFLYGIVSRDGEGSIGVYLSLDGSDDGLL